MKKYSVGAIVTGAVLILFALIFQKYTENTTFILSMVNAGTIMIIIGAVAYHKKELRSDERTKKMGAKALSVSWFITFIAINILFWVDELKLIEMSAKAVLSLLLPLMLLTGAGFQWWMRRQGDA